MNSNSKVELCQDKANEVPGIYYDFVKINEIAEKPANDKIDVIAIVTEAGDLTNMTTRTGRNTNKREIQLTDDSGTDIMATLWGENAVKYDADAIVGKVIAMKQVQVTDWNGKSLSVSFGTTIELNPDIAEATVIKLYYEASRQSQIQQKRPSLSSNEKFQPRGSGGAEENHATLREVHDDFRSASATAPARYYTVTAYLTEVKADQGMYKACPGDRCNRKVVDMDNGKFRCEKCSKEYEEFNWRYILRGAMADFSDYEVMTD